MSATKVLDISKICHQAKKFKKQLNTVKSTIGDERFGWYPYDSFGNIYVLNEMLKGRFRTLLSELDGALTLDFGCADGDIAFFLESLGFRVAAIDNPETNFNQMRGIRALKAALNSHVEIATADLDSRFDLPEGPYDLVFFLGILYHLKNPCYILDLLSRQSRFCFLSTRVARYTPDRIKIQNAPIAYLLGPDELNHDGTNFWIFSEAGLQRLLNRTGWEICEYLTLGDTRSSNPHTLENDERFYCLVRSQRFVEGSLVPRLIRGWHQLECNSWRWTERAFSVELSRPEHHSKATLEMGFVYPDLLKERIGRLRISTRIDDTMVQDLEYSSTGAHYYRIRVPERLLGSSTVLAEFELNGAIPPDSADLRERGIQIVPGSSFRWTQ
jgi:tRNA (mo5U34)-methyltransferase